MNCMLPHGLFFSVSQKGENYREIVLYIIYHQAIIYIYICWEYKNVSIYINVYRCKLMCLQCVWSVYN